MIELPHGLAEDLILRKLSNTKKISEMSLIKGKSLTGHT